MEFNVSKCFEISYHTAFIRIIESLQELNTSALPTSTAAHKSQSLTGLDAHIQPVQNLNIWPGGVRELAVQKLNVSFKIILRENTTEN